MIHQINSQCDGNSDRASKSRSAFVARRVDCLPWHPLSARKYRLYSVPFQMENCLMNVGISARSPFLLINHYHSHLDLSDL